MKSDSDHQKSSSSCPSRTSSDSASNMNLNINICGTTHNVLCSGHWSMLEVAEAALTKFDLFDGTTNSPVSVQHTRLIINQSTGNALDLKDIVQSQCKEGQTIQIIFPPSVDCRERRRSISTDAANHRTTARVTSTIRRNSESSDRSHSPEKRSPVRVKRNQTVSSPRELGLPPKPNSDKVTDTTDMLRSGKLVLLSPEGAMPCFACYDLWTDDANARYKFSDTDKVVHHACMDFATKIQRCFSNSLFDTPVSDWQSSLQNQAGVFHVHIKKAVDLTDVQLIGTQDPYARLCLFPWNEYVQTHPVASGGKNPNWKHDTSSQFKLLHPYNSDSTPLPVLRIELWNASFFSDVKIASCSIDMSPLLKYPGIEFERWFQLTDPSDSKWFGDGNSPESLMGSRLHNTPANAPYSSASSSSSTPSSSAPKGKSRRLGGRLLISVAFEPEVKDISHHGKPNSGRSRHKFRVHTMKSVGIKILKCVVCEKVIVGLKGIGYRCESCKVDVHSQCMMQANAQFECHQMRRTRQDTEEGMSEESIQRISPRRTLEGYKVMDTEETSNSKKPQIPDAIDTQNDKEKISQQLNDKHTNDSAPENDSSRVNFGDLYVHLQGLHICSEGCKIKKNPIQCRVPTLETDLQHHKRNVYDGNFYCRVSFTGYDPYETETVVKTNDPMFHERFKYPVFNRCSRFTLQVIDMSSDSVVGELSYSLYEILQWASDKVIQQLKQDPFLVFKNPSILLLRRNQTMVQYLPLYVRKADAASLSGTSSSTTSTASASSSSTSVSSVSSKRKMVGLALLDLAYEENVASYVAPVPLLEQNNGVTLRSKEELEFSIETLRKNVDRFQVILNGLKEIEAVYMDIITWEDKVTSSVFLVGFTACCFGISGDYSLFLVFLGIIVWVLKKLQERVAGAYWKKYIERDRLESDIDVRMRNLRYRPVAKLRVCVLEGKSFTTLYSSDWTCNDEVFIEVKYLPNDKERMLVGNKSEKEKKKMPLISSKKSEYTIGSTHSIPSGNSPEWRIKNVKDFTDTTSKSRFPSIGLGDLVSIPTDKPSDWFLKNVTVSWPHDDSVCTCETCLPNEETPSESLCTPTSTGYGVDYTALEYPLLQPGRITSYNRLLLLPWQEFPGEILFEVCYQQKQSTLLPGASVGSPALPAMGSPRGRGSSPGSTSTATTVKVIGSARVLLKELMNTEHGAQKEHIKWLDISSMDKAKEDKERASLRVRIQLDLPTLQSSSYKHTDNSLSASLDRKYSSIVQEAIGYSEDNSKNELMIEKKEFGSGTPANIYSSTINVYKKVKETTKTLQNDLGVYCGVVESIQSLANWSHPLKTLVFLLSLVLMTVLCYFVPSRYLIFLVGLSEFSVGYKKDKPPSKRFRFILENFLASLPTEDDIHKTYRYLRKSFEEKQFLENCTLNEELLKLRLSALWIGEISILRGKDKAWKSAFVAYRHAKFLCWKTREEAESGIAPYFQFFMDPHRPLEKDSIVHEVENAKNFFTVFGSSMHNSHVQEKVMFGMNKHKDLVKLVEVIIDDIRATKNKG